MPTDLKTIVQRMIDAGEPESAIASVIKRHGEMNPPLGEVSSSEPDTFSGGVMNSLMSGEALKAGAKGALGFAKGATLDIPSSIGGMLSSVAGAVAHPIDTLTNAPYNIKQPLQGMGDTFSKAGSEPEAFGRMMGQITGQPAVTAGLAKGAPMLKGPVGAGLEKVGGVMKEHQPISGTLPRLAEPRIMRTIERTAGRGIENLGKRMNAPPLEGESIASDLSNPKPTNKPPSEPSGKLQLGPKESSPWQDEMRARKTNPNKIDSRISGLPPEEASPVSSNRVSDIANRMAGKTGPTLFEQLSREAQRYGLSIEDYIASLRQGDQGFTMPSSEMPRVR